MRNNVSVLHPSETTLKASDIGRIQIKILATLLFFFLQFLVSKDKI